MVYSVCFVVSKGVVAIPQTIERFRSQLGAESVEAPDMGEHWSRGTDAQRHQAMGRLSVKSESDVVGILRIARELKVALHPISTGNNWGYGTASPPSEGCFLLDLSQMNQIGVENADLGVFSVEPGVTQSQLSRFLQEHNYPFLTPTTGAGPDCSILANAMERGYGITPYTDHFFSVMSVRVVLVDGTVYESPLDAVGANRVAGLFKWGFGSYLDGMFSQSNFGVITRIRVALCRRPEMISMLSFSSPDRSDASALSELTELIDRTRDIMGRYPGIMGSINLMNQRRVLAMTSTYPAETNTGVLSAQIARDLAKKHLVAKWTGVGSLYGEADVVAAASRGIKRILNSHSKRLVFFSRSKVNALGFAAKALPRRFAEPVNRVTGALLQGLDILNGNPNRVAHAAVYWALKKKFDAEVMADPATQGVGLLWYVPLLPARGAEICPIIAEIEMICVKHGIEPLVTLTAVSERCFDSSIPIVFERDDPVRSAAAHACFDELLAAGLARGIAPYRFGAQANAMILGAADTYAGVAARVKKALDPENLLSPGRYQR
jgi:4-cresol dehydrogenase (hydroxylating) flavoprotein subunit